MLQKAITERRLEQWCVMIFHMFSHFSLALIIQSNTMGMMCQRTIQSRAKFLTYTFSISKHCERFQLSALLGSWFIRGSHKCSSKFSVFSRWRFFVRRLEKLKYSCGSRVVEVADNFKTSLSTGDKLCSSPTRLSVFQFNSLLDKDSYASRSLANCCIAVVVVALTEQLDGIQCPKMFKILKVYMRFACS